MTLEWSSENNKLMAVISMINRSNSSANPLWQIWSFFDLIIEGLSRHSLKIWNWGPSLNNGAVRADMTILGRFHGCDSINKYQFWEMMVVCQDQDLNKFWTLNDKLLNLNTLKTAVKKQAVNLINRYNFVEEKKYSRSTKILNGSVNNICIFCYQPDVESSSTKISNFTGCHWNMYF